MKIYLFRFLIIAQFITSLFSTKVTLAQNNISADSRDSRVVEDLLKRMTTRDKIAQLFIVSFSSDTSDRSTIEAIEMVKTERVGGVILMNSTLTPAVKMINYLQSLSKIPLLVTIDGEWGAAMRFDSIVSFPRQMQLGALPSDSLVYRMGVAIGTQARRVGVDVNFAPTVDINNNPRNPVINTRSFGQDAQIVANYGVAYMRGMKDAGVMGSAKHFPGHGDTEVDSHNALPLLTFPRARIDSLELHPFRVLIEAGVDMVMAGHLQIPSLDSSGRPSSISKSIISDLLRRDLEYNGIIITDALNMKGVANYMAPELLPLEAFKAGCDIILMPEKASIALDIFERAVNSGEISMHSLNMRCKKILTAKMKLGILQGRDPISFENLHEDLNNPQYSSLISAISEQSLTLLRNEDGALPIKRLKDLHIGYLSMGGEKNGKELAEYLSLYTEIDTTILRGDYSNDKLIRALNGISNKDHIIIALHNTDSRPQRDFNLDHRKLKIITDFSLNKRVTFIYFGNPLAIPFIKNSNNFKSLIVAFSNTLHNNIAAAHLIFGATGSVGKLPVPAGEYPMGYGIKLEGGKRISYGVPLDLKIDSRLLNSSLDTIVMRDLRERRFNGAQLLVLYKGSVLVNSSYGNLRVDSEVNLNRISALISILPSITHLEAIGKISLEDFAGSIIKLHKSSPYNRVLISDLLMHRYSSDNKYPEFPQYTYENLEILKKIVVEKTKLKFEDFIKKELYDRAGMNHSSVRREGVFSNANDIAKFISIVKREGEYSGEYVIESKSASVIEIFAHYHSSTLNGGIVWSDKSRELTLIFLNNGDESQLNTQNALKTGDMLRHCLIDIFKIDN